MCCILVCLFEFGHQVCGESWLAIRDSLTHRPSSEGWAPGVLLSCYVWVFVNMVSIDDCGFFISLYGCFGCWVTSPFFLLMSLWLVCYTQWFHARWGLNTWKSNRDCDTHTVLYKIPENPIGRVNIRPIVMVNINTSWTWNESKEWHVRVVCVISWEYSSTQLTTLYIAAQRTIRKSNDFQASNTSNARTRNFYFT